MTRKDFINYWGCVIGIFLLLSCVVFNATTNERKTITAIEENRISAVSEIVEKMDNTNETLKELGENVQEITMLIADGFEVSADNDTKSETSPVVYESNATTQRFMVGEEVLLPALSTEPKLFTDYRSYNLWYTPHYRFQQAAYTDENGLRRFNEDYIVALGKYYSESIGDRFQITLDTGIEFTIIFGDGKAPCDCDENNMYTPCVNYDGEDCANVLEFIVDDDVMSSKVYAYGSIDCLDKFKGNIVKMVYLGRDSSADWDIYETR
ncbi:MAG: hypothetical protein NC299_15635 [Lachnospiraceae bacterium]|nr:hypothetical protein [Ruminococcus sp.]MCM1276765.1 hypothetical protein [Lachnospiraceae bacterium]